MSLRRHWPLIVVGLMMTLYLAYFGWFTLRAYDVFVPQAADLGIYDQTVWNTIHGRPFRSTLEEPLDTLLADHFEPILLLVALSYLVWPSAKALLFIQSTVLALGALPVYWLARDGLTAALASSRPAEPSGTVPDHPSAPWVARLVALAFACAYLLYPPMHSANVYEFHPSALAISLLLYTIYFLRKRRFILYALFLILTMSTKEVLPLTTFVLGLYAFFIEKERVVGLMTMLASALWFGLAVFVIIPHFSPAGQSQYFTVYYGWLGSSAREILVRLVTQPDLVWQRLTRPDSLLYMDRLLRPMAYIPLLGLPMLLLAVPALLLNLLSDFSFQHQSLTFFQYAAAIAPFVVLAAVDGTAFLIRHLGTWLNRGGLAAQRSPGPCSAVMGAIAGLILVASLLAQRYHGYLPFSADFYLAPRTERVAAAEAITQQVPLTGVLSADRIFGPHLSHRETIYLYPAVHDADYVVADVTYRDGPFPPRDRYDAIQAMLTSGQYGVVDGRYGYLLLSRGLDQQAIPDRFYDLFQAARPAPQVEMTVDFSDEVRLTGFDLVWERPLRPHAHLVLYWQALHPIERDLRLFFVQVDPSGQLVPGTELEFAATVWYPPSQWPVGAVIRTETVYWSIEEPGKFGVAVGVVEGPGFWEVDKRLRPVVPTAPWELPLIHDGSLVWLATLASDGRFVRLEKPEIRTQQPQ